MGPSSGGALRPAKPRVRTDAGDSFPTEMSDEVVGGT